MSILYILSSSIISLYFNVSLVSLATLNLYIPEEPGAIMFSPLNSELLNILTTLVSVVGSRKILS